MRWVFFTKELMLYCSMKKRIIWHFSFRKVQISNKRTYSIPNGSSGHRLKQKKSFFRNLPYINSSTCKLFLTYLSAFNAGFYMLSVKWKKIKWRFSFKKQLKLIQRIFPYGWIGLSPKKTPWKKIQGSHLRKKNCQQNILENTMQFLMKATVGNTNLHRRTRQYNAC